MCVYIGGFTAYSLGVAQVTYLTADMGMILIHAAHLFERERISQPDN